MRLYKRKRRKAGRRSVKIYMLSLYSCVEGYSWTSVANLLKIDASSRHRLPSKNLITFYKSRDWESSQATAVVNQSRYLQAN